MSGGWSDLSSPLPFSPLYPRSQLRSLDGAMGECLLHHHRNSFNTKNQEDGFWPPSWGSIRNDSLYLGTNVCLAVSHENAEPVKQGKVSVAIKVQVPVTNCIPRTIWSATLQEDAVFAGPYLVGGIGINRHMESLGMRKR